MPHRRCLTSAVALSVCSLFGTRTAAAQQAMPSGTTNARMDPEAAPGPPPPPRPYPSMRAGIAFLSFGAGFTDNSGYGLGAGVGVHLGVQATRLLGIYLRGVVHYVLFSFHGEADVLADFAVTDRVQVGAGLGVMGVDTGSFIGSSHPGSAWLVPLHLGFSPALWHHADRTRSALQISLDLAPGIAFDGAFAGSGSVALGWEWY